MAVNQKGVYRVLDANFNRAKEGLRVCEDICRFVLNKRVETKKLKDIRHQMTEIIGSLNFSKFIECRDIEKDVGKKTSLPEMKRKEIRDIFFANTQRMKESIRVLEEFAKLLNTKSSQEFKLMRYQIYAIEKKLIKAF